MGLFWDGSFLGNIEYYDGLKLNPDWGVCIEGEKVAQSGKVGFRIGTSCSSIRTGINDAFRRGTEG